MEYIYFMTIDSDHYPGSGTKKLSETLQNKLRKQRSRKAGYSANWEQITDIKNLEVKKVRRKPAHLF
jgi:hypothetical protein